MFCGQCGVQAEESAKFCKNCGAKLREDGGRQPAVGSPARPAQHAENALLNTAPKNKYIKPAVLFGCIVIVAVIIIAAVKSSNSGEQGDMDNEFAGESGGEDFYGDDYYGDYYDDYDSVTAHLDTKLCGRWRSYDGGALEFTDDGFITSCDFKCWSMYGEKPDYITWYAENGRVICDAYFDNNYTYKINYSDVHEAELFYLKNSGDNKYVRVAGKEGDGLVGTWNSVWSELWSFQFNADGSGMYNGKFPFSWYEDADGVLYYTLCDETYFDYSVTGDTLTVFLSDGSRVYTRVGN